MMDNQRACPICNYSPILNNYEYCSNCGYWLGKYYPVTPPKTPPVINDLITEDTSTQDLREKEEFGKIEPLATIEVSRQADFVIEKDFVINGRGTTFPLASEEYIPQIEISTGEFVEINQRHSSSEESMLYQSDNENQFPLKYHRPGTIWIIILLFIILIASCLFWYQGWKDVSSDVYQVTLTPTMFIQTSTRDQNILLGNIQVIPALPVSTESPKLTSIIIATTPSPTSRRKIISSIDGMVMKYTNCSIYSRIH